MESLTLFIYLFLFISFKVTAFPTNFINGKLEVANCDFENGLCTGYEHDQTMDFKWSINSGTTGSPDTGPDGDHTDGFNGKGHYLYIESSEKYSHQHARINTVTMTAANLVMDIEKICLGFYYHMKGHTMGNLTVFLQDTSTGVEEKLFQLSGNQGNKWRRATIPVNTPKSDFKIIIEGSTSYSFYGDIAIDDIKLSKYSGSGCYFWPTSAIPAVVPTIPIALHGPENSSSCGLPVTTASGRIIGGNDAVSGAWPWMAMIQRRDSSDSNYKYHCGGTLLGAEWVVTAAHCLATFKSADQFRIRLGTHDRISKNTDTQDIDVSDIYVHELYKTKEMYNNDVALIKLKQPAKISKKINSVCLPEMDWEVKPGTKCYVAGWGKLWNDNKQSSAPHSRHLKQGILPIRSHANCTKTYGNQVTDNMLCAGTDIGIPDTCVGDSGSPLMCFNKGKWQLVGITSWGHNIGCGYAGKYGVYTYVRKIQDWIKQVTTYTQFYRPLHYVASY